MHHYSLGCKFVVGGINENHENWAPTKYNDFTVSGILHRPSTISHHDLFQKPDMCLWNTDTPGNKIKALRYWGRMEFLISASQALNSIYLTLKTDWKTNSIVDNQKNFQNYIKISQGIVLKEKWLCRYFLVNLKDLNGQSRLKTYIKIILQQKQ